MKEKLDERKRTVERDSVFEKNGRGKERSKKENEAVQLFFLKKEKKKRRSFQKEQNNVLSECKDYVNKKHFPKEDSQTLENVF